MIITIITFIIVFGILVVVHEFGHFIVAKKSGIMVREFSIGMGPKIFYHRFNGTTYTLRMLPIGGYVRMAGSADDEDEEIQPGTPVTLKVSNHNQVSSINLSKKQTLFQGIPVIVTDSDLERELWIKGYQNGDESSVKKYSVDHDATIVESDGTEVQIAPLDVQFQSAPLWKRILTNFAGIFNNVLLAVITFMILSFVQGGVSTNSNQVNPLPKSSAARNAGIKSNDRITNVNGTKTDNWNQLQVAIQKHPNQKIKLAVNHNGSQKNVTLKTDSTKANGKKVGVIGVKNVLDHSFTAKLMSGITQTWSMTVLLVGFLFRMIMGHFSLNDLGGPVAIFATTSQATKLGLSGVLYFLGFLSINLAIVNLVPIPALDGGKILLNIIEGIRRKPLSEKVEMIITFIGFAFILVLMVLVTWNDIERYFLH
ncbi:zinc metalloprotease [Philodulcilactobacillus myokoensis]|uniref:Zinc metalloprotease n=1 Tax=Philodulcilactobacillus myokoensis TaxID=2929573 RepID=A0A9W6B2K6_9LACO|nr:RIP metalloprotease RseP [Philodulcilactobacillus myokoensis]GLB46949.1 zinc metalloprotease [Philodulcilactobacillus myokoensis]